ncbi:alpha/beta hydrolase [Streptomyces sp. NPDC048045]|uniref:alpha/beta hydrolase n=1 Tax=Streptomyces sp. NPDC048045 TaxID=3154710 RepID=UPI00341265C5
MSLHPQVAALRARLLAAGTRPLYALRIEEARAADLAAARASGGEPEPVRAVVDGEFPGPAGSLPVRFYRPRADDTPLPVLCYFYGGGWTLGSIDTCDAICRRLANATGCLVAAAGYRLAPENPYPAAVEDCRAAVRWLAGHAHLHGGDGSRLAVGGDSAGGNLAAVVSLHARDHGGPPIAAQLLVYPNTDYLADTESRRENSDEVFFNHRSVDWYWRHYLTDPAHGREPYVSPLRAPSLSGLPPALVITAEYDPLRDEGENYAERLAAEGVDTRLSRYDGMIHGFFAMRGVLDPASDALDEAAAFLRAHLAAPPPRTDAADAKEVPA